MKNNKSKNYWLLKTEPDVFSIDDLQRVKKEDWTGVRNFQARNFMRDAMNVGDICFFYHSSCEVPGIAGLCKVSKVQVIDKLQFDKKSEYFDPKSKTENPTWVCVEVEFLKKFEKVISLTEIKALAKREKGLLNMRLLQPGSRLSVQPVSPNEYKCIVEHFGLL